MGLSSRIFLSPEGLSRAFLLESSCTILSKHFFLEVGSTHSTGPKGAQGSMATDLPPGSDAMKTRVILVGIGYGFLYLDAGMTLMAYQRCNVFRQDDAGQAPKTYPPQQRHCTSGCACQLCVVHTILIRSPIHAGLCSS